MAEQKQENLSPVKPDQDLQSILTNEYDQLCEDWRYRDNSVLQKFIPQSVLLVSIIGTAQIKDQPLIMFFFFFACFCLSSILTMSTTKDMYYIWGTRATVQGLVDKLGIQKNLAAMPLPENTEQNATKREEQFKFPRSISLDKDKFSHHTFPGIVQKIVKLLITQKTFMWIVIVQMLMSLFFLVLSVVSVVLFALSLLDC